MPTDAPFNTSSPAPWSQPQSVPAVDRTASPWTQPQNVPAVDQAAAPWTQPQNVPTVDHATAPSNYMNDTADLAEQITGMYRILDLISEDGSGGLGMGP